MQGTAYRHIEMDAKGRPVIAGTGTRVSMIAMDRMAYHWDADEIQRQREHLTLAQIYSALAYYYDHEAEMNREIWEEEKFVEAMRSKLDNGPVREKLLAAKKARW